MYSDIKVAECAVDVGLFPNEFSPVDLNGCMSPLIVTPETYKTGSFDF